VPPSPPQSFNIVNENVNSLELAWSRPGNPYGEIKFYMVSCSYTFKAMNEGVDMYCIVDIDILQ